MWNLTGMQVKGNYLGDIEVAGKVTLSRVEYGGNVSHHIKLDKAFDAGYGNIRRAAGDVVIVDHKYITEVRD